MKNDLHMLDREGQNDLMSRSAEEDARRGVQSPTPISKLTDTGLKKVTAVQDWTGPDDSGDPMKWSFWKKVYHTVPPATFTLIVTAASSIYTPGIPDLMRSFEVSSTVALLGLSLYILGLAFGPMLAAPISETKGRLVVYLISIPAASLFVLGAGFSQSFTAFAVCRFFAGFFASPVLAVGSLLPCAFTYALWKLT